MDIKVINFHKIRMEYYWQKLGIWDILLKIYKVSKSIAAAKSQNFVNTLGPEKSTRTKFLEFDFFLIWKDKVIRYYQEKTKLGSHHLHT